MQRDLHLRLQQMGKDDYFMAEQPKGVDRLNDMFERQEEFMELLEKNDKLPPWPIDLTTKQGQRMAREIIQCLVEEIYEASFTLKNKMHRITDVDSFDAEHYKEELGDALAFFIELCIMSGISSTDLHEQFCKKNAEVKQRFEDGY